LSLWQEITNASNHQFPDSSEIYHYTNRIPVSGIVYIPIWTYSRKYYYWSAKLTLGLLFVFLKLNTTIKAGSVCKWV